MQTGHSIIGAACTTEGHACQQSNCSECSHCTNQPRSEWMTWGTGKHLQNLLPRGREPQCHSVGSTEHEEGVREPGKEHWLWNSHWEPRTNRCVWPRVVQMGDRQAGLKGDVVKCNPTKNNLQLKKIIIIRFTFTTLAEIKQERSRLTSATNWVTKHPIKAGAGITILRLLKRMAKKKKPNQKTPRKKKKTTSLSLGEGKGCASLRPARAAFAPQWSRALPLDTAWPPIPLYFI